MSRGDQIEFDHICIMDALSQSKVQPVKATQVDQFSGVIEIGTQSIEKAPWEEGDPQVTF